MDGEADGDFGGGCQHRKAVLLFNKSSGFSGAQLCRRPTAAHPNDKSLKFLRRNNLGETRCG